MSEELWWKHFGWFYKNAGRSRFVQNVHGGFFRHVDGLGLPTGSRVLDAGCGVGSSSFPLAERGFNVLAVDFGDSVIEEARKTNERTRRLPNIRFGWMDLSQPLPLESGSFDLITSLHCIMKIPNVDDTLREFFRILKPGGKMVISTTPDNYTIPQWLRRYASEKGWPRALWDIRWLAAWAAPYWLFTRKSERKSEHRWDETAFDRHLSDAGFVTLEIERVPYIHVGCIIGRFEKPNQDGKR